MTTVPMAERHQYNEWMAKEYRKLLSRWEDPQDLADAKAIGFLTQIVQEPRPQSRRQAVRQCIDQRDWESMRTLHEGTVKDDLFAWFVLEREFGCDRIVEIDDFYDYMYREEIYKVWKLDCQHGQKAAQIATWWVPLIRSPGDPRFSPDGPCPFAWQFQNWLDRIFRSMIGRR